MFLMVVMACGRGLAQGNEPGQGSGQNPPQSSGSAGQQLPDAPGAEKEKKDETANPVQAVADKTKEAAEATKDGGDGSLCRLGCVD